mgnify:FL=1
MLNRSIICKVANKLRKSGYTLSQAFHMAWKLAKGKASVKVAGVTKERRQEAIEHLSRYNPETVSFSLQREKQNSFDRNAIAVYARVKGGKPYKMGYVSAAVACLLSGVIDNITAINARLQAITGGFYADMVQGLRLTLSI